MAQGPGADHSEPFGLPRELRNSRTGLSQRGKIRRVPGFIGLLITGSPVWKEGRNALFVVFDEGNGPLTCPNYNPDTGTDVVPGTLLPGPDCYDPKNFNDKVVMLVITNYGRRGLVDNHFYDHFSLLKTIEAAFDLPFIGHARDPGTHTMAPLLQPKDD